MLLHLLAGCLAARGCGGGRSRPGARNRAGWAQLRATVPGQRPAQVPGRVAVMASLTASAPRPASAGPLLVRGSRPEPSILGSAVMVGHRAADDLAGGQVQPAGEVEPALSGGPVGDVTGQQSEPSPVSAPPASGSGPSLPLHRHQNRQVHGREGAASASRETTNVGLHAVAPVPDLSGRACQRTQLSQQQ